MNFICFDTEDNSKELLAAGKSGFKKRVTQIAAIAGNGDKFHNRGDVGEFKKWLLKRRECYVYALNIQYDLGNLFGKSIDELDQTLVGGRVIKAKWENKVFVDVFNIWPMSVKKLGEAFGLKKLETGSMATDKRYVFRDVEIIRAAMLFAWKFCQPLGVKNLPPTLGGLCVKLWKKWGGQNCHDSTELSREAYFGGRVELFKKRNETPNVCWTDINSLYPAMMLKPFPGSISLWEEKRMPKFGVVKCRVKVPKMELCPLPFRDSQGRILFPWGRFTGTWTVAEIQAAKQRGVTVEKVFECYGTDDSSIPYAVFVEKLYAARLASKSPAEKLFFKLLMNNLYGRLGTSGVIGRTVWQTEKNKFDGIPFGQKVLVNYSMPLSEETNWLHAAYVTAYGRIALLEFMETIGADKMIYCDTDSTIFDCPSEKIPFPVGTGLGVMKLESWETRCETYAPKMYRVGKLWKAKGVPQRLAKKFIQTGHAEFDLPFKMREAIRFFDRMNSRQLSVWRQVSKQNRQTYDKKNLTGNHYSPCKVNSV